MPEFITGMILLIAVMAIAISSLSIGVAIVGRNRQP